MMHAVFTLVGVFMVFWGVVISGLLISVSIKAGKAMWLVTVPGVLIIAVLALDFACHLFHLPRRFLPHQEQVVGGIRWTLRLAAIPLLLGKLFELAGKRRAKAARSLETAP